MAEYISKEVLLDRLDIENALGGHYGISFTEINKIPAADVVERDEGIRMGAELAAMHGSDATSQELEKAYLDGVAEGLRKARKTGKWEKFDDGIKYWWMCSECHHDSLLFRADLTNFCPNCGADMQ